MHQDQMLKTILANYHFYKVLYRMGILRVELKSEHRDTTR